VEKFAAAKNMLLITKLCFYFVNLSTKIAVSNKKLNYFLFKSATGKILPLLKRSDVLRRTDSEELNFFNRKLKEKSSFLDSDLSRWQTRNKSSILVMAH